MRLSGKLCLITGSSKGIGKGIATALAREGATIVINYHSDDHAARTTTDEIAGQYGTEVEVVKADVSKEEDVARMMQVIVQRFGGLDILVNNAGVHIDKVTWKMDAPLWESVIATNLSGVFFCMKHAIPLMRQKGWGRIVNMSSVAGQVGLFGASNYCASKSGIFGLTKAVAREVADKNITVNCIALGYFDAGMNLRLSEDVRERALQMIPMRRFGRIEEAVGPVVFLCTDEASYITGQVFHVNGGYYM
jgi:3-oxoacyl-[acyl-carrier protein] reductase